MSVIKLVKKNLFLYRFFHNDFHYTFFTYNTAAGDLYSVGRSSLVILTYMNFWYGHLTKSSRASSPVSYPWIEGSTGPQGCVPSPWYRPAAHNNYKKGRISSQHFYIFMKVFSSLFYWYSSFITLFKRRTLNSVQILYCAVAKLMEVGFYVYFSVKICFGGFQL